MVDLVANGKRKNLPVKTPANEAWSLKQLSLELFDGINCYNNLRIYVSLGYLSPVVYRTSALKKAI